ncbi:putative conserved alanine rich membrane protein [Serinicoccus hydrothermalis]|uniref:Putative conserved alanine rich membrane protein n=1 Tax=Serinicoccus hydrothermalis TaxID=1758689 RepID=A0A1B1NBU3_9MICO|nr:type II secretion system F family protein [Serinicoccus hydrothermalis]ANS78892.1 putative conserved alanine rich membrane protein [Serinicoccus hydrothermalis]
MSVPTSAVDPSLLVLLVATTAALVPLVRVRAPRASWTPADRPAATHSRGPCSADVAEALDLMALALQGGVSLGTAARTVALELDEPLRAELDAVGLDLLDGVDAAPSWDRAGARWEPARRTIEVAALAGVPPGPALRQTATDLRRGSVARAEVATARLGVRLVLPLGLAFLPAFVLTTVAPLVLALVRDLSW